MLGKRRRNQSPQTLLAGTQSDAAARGTGGRLLQTVNGESPPWPPESTPRRYSTERGCSHTSWHMNVHSRPVHNRQEVEATQMFDRGMDKRAFTRWAIISAPETESSTDTWYNVDEPWKHCAEWKKPGTRKATRYLFQLLRNIETRQIHRDKKAD